MEPHAMIHQCLNYFKTAYERPRRTVTAVVFLCTVSSILLTAATAGFCGLDSRFEKLIRKRLNIEHVFSRFSSDCGPGTILQYTKNSNYIMAIAPWEAIGVSREEYERNIDTKTPIAGMDSYLDDSIEANFEVQMSSAQANAGNKRTIKVRFTLSNGMKHTLTQTDTLSRILDNARSEGKVRTALRDIKETTPGVKFYIVKEVYAYDYNYLCEWNNSWVALAELPRDVLRMVSVQIGIGSVSSSSIQSKGDGYFIGFNGYRVKKSRFDPQSITATIFGGNKLVTKDNLNLIDITDEIK